MLIDRLFVEIGANVAPLQAGLARANAEVTAFTARATTGAAATGALAGAFKSLLPIVGVLGAIQLFRGSAEQADLYEGAVRRLGATARITGQDLGFMQGVAGNAEQAFGLSAQMATDLTIELTKLSAKAGDVANASAGLRAFLDIGAARGLNAEQTLQAVRQAILGIDEGTDKLFNANPSVLYQRYAEAIGVSVAKLTDQQKAQAILNAALEDGAKVQGEYGRFLETNAGGSQRAGIAAQQFGIMFGQAMSGVRDAFNATKVFLLDGLTGFVGGLQILAVEITGYFLKIPDEVSRAVGHALFAIAGLVHRVAPLLESLGWEGVEEIAGQIEARAVSMLANARREIDHVNTAVDELRNQIAGVANLTTGAAGAASTLPPGGDAVEKAQAYADALSTARREYDAMREKMDQLAALNPSDFFGDPKSDAGKAPEEVFKKVRAEIDAVSQASGQWTSMLSGGLADVLLQVESLTEALENLFKLIFREVVTQAIAGFVGAVLNPVSAVTGSASSSIVSGVSPSSRTIDLSGVADDLVLMATGRQFKEALASGFRSLEDDGFRVVVR